MTSRIGFGGDVVGHRNALGPTCLIGGDLPRLDQRPNHCRGRRAKEQLGHFGARNFGDHAVPWVHSTITAEHQSTDSVANQFWAEIHERRCFDTGDSVPQACIDDSLLERGFRRTVDEVACERDIAQRLTNSGQRRIDPRWNHSCGAIGREVSGSRQRDDHVRGRNPIGHRARGIAVANPVELAKQAVAQLCRRQWCDSAEDASAHNGRRVRRRTDTVRISNDPAWRIEIEQDRTHVAHCTCQRARHPRTCPSRSSTARSINS